jgi:regulator of cell morphogenesis and NO signaling
MSKLENKTVGEIAAEFPSTTRIFEKLKIDYCCGGTRTLKAACEEAGVQLEEVSLSLENAAMPTADPAAAKDWNRQPLSDLIDHIQSTHHSFTRTELARLDPLLEKVESVHGGNHPELSQIRHLFQGLSGELTLHLHKEEVILFPFIARLEEAVKEGKPVPIPPFGTLHNPVGMMEREHEQAGKALEEMRRLSRNYTLPPEGCVSFRTLYQALPEFEADLHQHIHLENNILFPRALALSPRAMAAG